ncbi:hypothetical protein [Streptomyces sp. NPDC086023]|uniref:hypothetical protein n=1 Tax=Streptomyces sp. NPDC086023 TaxID=3365746 RepID=UPI0037CCD9C9
MSNGGHRSHVTGLECWVIPMPGAALRDRRRVLTLTRVELIVLLKLVETLFAPGWVHRTTGSLRLGYSRTARVAVRQPTGSGCC